MDFNLHRIVHEPALEKAKKRQYFARRAEEGKQKRRMATRRAESKKMLAKSVDYISPDRIVKDYREKQKSYVIYKRAVNASLRA